MVHVMLCPLVTVCVPTYNKASLLRQSLESILAQTFSDFKLIVVDDHSSDDTWEVVTSLRDERVEYVFNATNLGYTANCNRCIDLALESRSRYIAIYYDDDYYAPTILEREVNFLERHSRVGFVHTAQFYYKEDESRYSLARPYPTDCTLSGIELLDDLCLRGRYHITTPSVLARRDAYVKAGNFESIFKVCPDLDLWWRMLEHYDMGYVAEPLLTQRIHRQQISSSAKALSNAIVQKELLIVLERALQRLDSKYHNINLERYRAGINRYYAKQVLFVSKDALLRGDATLLSEACGVALQLTPTFVTYVSVLCLRLFNNSLGRRVAFVVIKVARSFRERAWLFDPRRHENLIPCGKRKVDAVQFSQIENKEAEQSEMS